MSKEKYNDGSKPTQNEYLNRPTPLEALNEIHKVLSFYDSPNLLLSCFELIETALKNQKRKLDLIGEVLVDVSKGNYADLNDAINDIREVL